MDKACAPACSHAPRQSAIKLLGQCWCIACGRGAPVTLRAIFATLAETDLAMSTLSVQDTQLAANDRVTVGKLLKLEMGASDTKYTMTAEALGANGLSTNALVALVRAALPKQVDANGVETRPKTFVAKEVTVYASGTAEFTLAFDLVA
jgi:hypothetical protein